jgi:L,D-peptidoglycan transpeptidase YkuD (ErfK/YbiS/YcfS/YnhG family)
MTPHDRLIVRRAPGGNPASGLLLAGQDIFPCRLGRTGIAAVKRESDGHTPLGVFPLMLGFYRADRLRLPPTALELLPIAPRDGWCDDPGHPAYNRPVDLPFAASHEKMWRDDSLYDICLVLDHNMSARARNRGSAIFMHLTGGKPFTQGCIAVERDVMLKLLPRLAPGTLIDIRA